MKAVREIAAAVAFVLATSVAATASPQDATARMEPIVLDAPRTFSSRARPSIESLGAAPIASRLEFSAPRRGPLLRAAYGVSPFIFQVPPPKGPERVGIGHTWSLSGGRALVMDLTPSPLHCAPYVSLMF